MSRVPKDIKRSVVDVVDLYVPAFVWGIYMMHRTQIRDTLKGILEDETDNQLNDLPDELVLIDAFDLDSVDRVSLMMRVEEQFHIRMTNDELSGIGTIGSLVDLVQAKVAELSSKQTVLRAA